MLFRARQFEYSFPRPALLMGILNVTPDSFSDGGKFLEVDAAVKQGLELARQGADIIDVGGESTRPGAVPVTAAEELRRVLPVIEELARQLKVAISIDTLKPTVAAAAMQAGASIINDVGSVRMDDSMLEVAAKTGAGYVLMHSQGTPATMQHNPQYHDVLAEVEQFFGTMLARAKQAGLADEQIVLDVGIGFGKTVAHNLQLLAGLKRFMKFGRPVLLGVSRKSFIGRLDGNGENDRLPGSLAATVLAAEAGVQLFRTHDVAPTLAALRMAAAIREKRAD